MNPSTENPSPLPEKNEKKSEPAPVVVQEDKKRYLYEGTLIVLSVLLALFLNEVRSTWQEARRTEDMIENLRNELRKNKATVEGQYSYLTTVLNNIDSAQANETYQEEIFKNGKFRFTELAPLGVFSTGFIEDIAWEIARNNNIYSKIDFEVVSLLSQIYRQQAMVKKGYEMVGDIISSRESRDPDKASETLSMIYYNAYGGYSYDRMPQLLRFYDEALERLAAY